jgi:hypothetical protein
MYDIPGMIQFYERRTIFYARYIKAGDTYREKRFGAPGTRLIMIHTYIKVLRDARTIVGVRH